MAIIRIWIQYFLLLFRMNLEVKIIWMISIKELQKIISFFFKTLLIFFYWPSVDWLCKFSNFQVLLLNQGIILFIDCDIKYYFSIFADLFGALPEWPNGADCKSADVRLRWFESITPHEKSGSSSVGRATAFQAVGRGFEPRLPLKLPKWWNW